MILQLILLLTLTPDTIRVSNRMEFIQAVAPERVIVIEKGSKIILSLSEGEEPPVTPWENPHVYWSSEFDGSGMVIIGVSNLVIMGESPRSSTLLARPRYVYTLYFNDCRNVRLENLILGHTEGGYCTSGVLGFGLCSGVEAIHCSLFGCGTEGLTIDVSSDLTFTDCMVYDCTYGIMSMWDSRDIGFTDCLFKRNREYWGVDLYDCEDISFTNCVFRDNEAHWTEGFFNASTTAGLVLTGCEFTNILCDTLFSPGSDPVLN